MKYQIGVLVRCIHGRFKGRRGIISYYDPNGHNDSFCMRVYPDVGERVNPANWEVMQNNIRPVCPVDVNGKPLLPNILLDNSMYQ